MPDSTTDRPVIGAVTGSDATLLIDAGASPAHAAAFLREIDKLKIPPVRYLVYTHWHWDHIWGASEIVARHRPAVIAHRMTRDKVRAQAELAWDDASLDERVRAGQEVAYCRDKMKTELPSRADLTIVSPTLTFDGTLEIELGGVHCILEHVGGDHAPDSTIVHVCERKVMFAGDAPEPSVYSAARHFTKQQLFPLIDRLLSYDAETYILSHVPVPIPRDHFAAIVDTYKLVGRYRLDEHMTAEEIIARMDPERFVGMITHEMVHQLCEEFDAGARALKAES